MKKALITGITGFVGSHLAEYLLDRKMEVYGTVRWRSKTENIEHITNKIDQNKIIPNKDSVKIIFFILSLGFTVNTLTLDRFITIMRVIKSIQKNENITIPNQAII